MQFNDNARHVSAAGLLEKQATTPSVVRPSVPENRHQLGKGNCDLVGGGRQKKREVTTRAGLMEKQTTGTLTPTWKEKRKGNCDLVGKKRGVTT